VALPHDTSERLNRSLPRRTGHPRPTGHKLPIVHTHCSDHECHRETARGSSAVPYARAHTKRARSLSTLGGAPPLAGDARCAACACARGHPIADAATKAVKRALFADNATKVGGFKASKRPRGNQLPPLDSHAKFPASVLPKLLKGDKGDRGEPGALGPAGATARRLDRRRPNPRRTRDDSRRRHHLDPADRLHLDPGRHRDDLFVGSLTFKQPTGCSASGLSVTITAGGLPVTSVGYLTPPTNPIQGWLLDPGAATPRAITVTAVNNCNVSSSGILETISINVIKFS
jgi:hypothetical protein